MAGKKVLKSAVVMAETKAGLSVGMMADPRVALTAGDLAQSSVE